MDKLGEIVFFTHQVAQPLLLLLLPLLLLEVVRRALDCCWFLRL